ncbi:polysaccharide lyase [uncultured Bacteroides sp.]|uniref:polysaccharide lyase n=1 Tax=uncultured Bacteroides sp. TaxID=162156 RepID=UPI002AAAD84D|nr:polysaccharide lyase [uncultured Bacteroides sp.]
MKKNVLTVALLSALLAAQQVRAQYPVVPDSIKKRSEAMLKEAEERSDVAWQKALPVINEEAKHGKPYIDWAARPIDLPQAKIPAFPGAMGGGEFTFGGRGGKVITVTSLADSGPGTFREACETGGARIIVFNIAGIIHLKTPVIIRAPYITIAGQTAPGDGVCIAGETVWANTHDVVVRHMRFRRGATDVGRRDDAFGGDPIGNIMIDHCSCSWGLDENISFYRHMFDPKNGRPQDKLPTVNVTIQNTISAQGLDTYNHAFGSTIGGENCSFMRNLWADNAGRNPSIGWNGIFNFANNVIYNWLHRTVDGGDYTAMYNIINNYYKPGPATPKDALVGHRIIEPQSAGRSKLDHAKFGRLYVVGNIMEGNDQVTKDNWNGGVQLRELKGAQISQEDAEKNYFPLMKVDEPFTMPQFPIMSANEAYNYVLDNAGANFPKRDIIDERIIHQVRTGEVYYDKKADSKTYFQFKYRKLQPDSYKLGIITDISQVGGYPQYKGKPYKDSDGDGMPDAWEIKYGLNPHDASDANGDLSGDGYTNIEKYINGIDPTKKVDWKDSKNNHDTLVGKKSLY